MLGEIRLEVSIATGMTTTIQRQTVTTPFTEYVFEEYNSTPDKWNFMSRRAIPVTSYRYSREWVVIDTRPSTQAEIDEEWASLTDDLVI